MAAVLETWQAWAIIIPGGLVTIGTVGRTVRAVIRWGRRLERVMNAVEDQLYPNGGSTLRDAVIDIQTALGLDPVRPKKKEHQP